MKRRDWILTKNEVMRKIREMLEQLQVTYEAHALSHADAGSRPWLEVSPKVSRGENYRGLPWLVLDYPRYFRGEDMVAVRTMFWWGEHFSVTLLMAGAPMKACAEKLKGSYAVFRRHGYHYCVHPSPWEHHFEADNYIPFGNMTAAAFRRHISETAFFKAGKRFPVGDFDDLPSLLEGEYKRLMRILQGQLPRR